MDIGIIGLGRMGKNHLRVLCNLKDFVDKIYVFDIDNKTCHNLANIYGVISCTDMLELITNSDAVIICTPTTTHYKIAELCVMNNKDILIEKPITSDINEADALTKLIKRNNVICMVGHVERYNPAVIYALEYLKGKNIRSIEARRISKIEIGRDYNVDVVIDLMIHDIDIITDITRNIPDRINAVSSNNKLDEVFAIMQYSNNLTACLSASRISQNKIRELHISTGNENLYLDYIKNKIEIVKIQNIDIPSSDNIFYKQIGSSKTFYFEGEPLKIELQSFLNHIKNRTIPLSNEHTGFTALDIAKKIVDGIAAK